MSKSKFNTLQKVASAKRESKEKTDSHSWLNDYIEERKTKKTGNTDKDSSTSWWGSSDVPVDINPIHAKKKESHSYGGKGYSRSYSDWDDFGYGSGYGGSYDKSWKNRKTNYTPSYGNYYSGGSGDILSSSNRSWYSNSYSSGAAINGREYLDIRNFVSNLASIHDSTYSKKVKLPEVGMTQTVGNMLSEESEVIPLLAEVFLLSSKDKTFSDKLDILSGQVLMTGTLLKSDLKTRIKNNLTNSIVTYVAKQPASTQEDIKNLLQRIISLLAENLAEMDIIKKSPGYTNYVKTFRDYFYGERIEKAIGEHGKFSLLDAVYMKYRNPEGMDSVLKVAKDKLGEKHTAIKKVEGFMSMLDSVIKIDTLTEENLFDIGVQILMILITCASEDDVDFTSNTDISQSQADDAARAMGNIRSTGDTGVIEQLSGGKFTEAEEISVNALRILDEYDYNSYEMNDPITEGTSYGSKFNIDWLTMKGDKAKYERIRADMEAYVPRLKRVMKFRDFIKKVTLTSQKRGRIDKRKLAQANYHDRIYKKTLINKAQDVSICLVVDESGSMTGPGISGARALACLFHEAFFDSKSVELHTYGHTAQEGSLTGEHDWTYDSKQVIIRKYPTKESISDIRARANNLDGVALVAIAEEFNKVAKGENKIMIVLSDGNPAGSGYSGSKAVEHTRLCVEKVEQMGITPMQVAIAPRVNSDLMFKRWFKFADMDKFIPDMEGMIKRILKNYSG